MCRVHERIYISPKGDRSKFEDSFPCDKSRNGKLCSKVKRWTTEKHDYNSSRYESDSDDGQWSDLPESRAKEQGKAAYAEHENPHPVERYEIRRREERKEQDHWDRDRSERDRMRERAEGATAAAQSRKKHETSEARMGTDGYQALEAALRLEDEGTKHKENESSMLLSHVRKTPIPSTDHTSAREFREDNHEEFAPVMVSGRHRYEARDIPSPRRSLRFSDWQESSQRTQSSNIQENQLRWAGDVSFSSYASPEFSIAKYAAADTAKATKDLIFILRDNEALSPLYGHAVADPNIGPEKLEQNLRKFFKTYSEQLKLEAHVRVDVLASHFVRLKARAVARCIVQKHSTVSYPTRYSGLKERHERSSDDDLEPQPAYKDSFHSLDNFRDFLTGGEAFQSLQKQVRSFVSPKAVKQELNKVAIDNIVTSTLPVPITADEGHNDAGSVASEVNGYPQVDDYDIGMDSALDNRTRRDGFMLDFVGNTVTDLNIALGRKEPRIQSGFTRLRWRCSCGYEIFGDAVEHSEGGIARTIERIRRSTGSNVVTTPSGQGTDHQALTSRDTQWMRNVGRKLSSVWQELTDRTPGLPQHTPPAQTAVCTSSTANQSQSSSLNLMSCMQRSKYRRLLYQDFIDTITTDQALFRFLQRQIMQRRGRMRNILTLRCIQGIYFVKFRLRASGDAELRTHIPCWTSAIQKTCNCIPPSSMVEPPDAEYRCSPAGPPELCPPILSEELMHMLTSPDCIDPKETFVLDQIPKRTKGELKGTIGQPAEGWGIHFQEGWDFDLLIGIVLVVFLFASLLFAVLWSYFKLDVQGAFGVSSYMVTATGIFVAWFANRAGKMG